MPLPNVDVVQYLAKLAPLRWRWGDERGAGILRPKLGHRVDEGIVAKLYAIRSARETANAGVQTFRNWRKLGSGHQGSCEEQENRRILNFLEVDMDWFNKAVNA